MGVGSRSRAWRFTDINKDYTVGYLYFMSRDHLPRVLSNFSSVPLILLDSLFRPESAMLRYSTLPNIGVNVGYLF